MRVLYVLPLILVLFVPTLSHGLDVGDDVPYIKYMEPYFAINKNPTICIIEPKDKLVHNGFYNTTNIAISSINNWVDGLTERTGGDWKTNIISTSSTNNKPIGFNKCDIKIQFKMYDFNNPTTAGITNTSFFLKPTTDIEIYTHKLTKINNTNWEARQRTAYIIQDIVEHELGHAFNLEHYYNVGFNGTDTYHIKYARASIMYPSTPPLNDVYFKIQENDFNAVINRFGRDGWNGEVDNTSKYYTIP